MKFRLESRKVSRRIYKNSRHDTARCSRKVYEAIVTSHQTNRRCRGCGTFQSLELSSIAKLLDVAALSLGRALSDVETECLDNKFSRTFNAVAFPR